MTHSRRKFLRDAATLASLSGVPPQLFVPAISERMPVRPGQLGFERTPNRILITGANGIAIELMLESGRVLGVSAVRLDGKSLRNTTECIWPEITTPYGAEAIYFELIGVEQRGDQVIVSTRPYYRIIHRMEWTEHAMHPLINTNSWSKLPESPTGSRLDWIFTEAAETWDDAAYKGFSYSFRYSGPGYPIYQIEDKASWELGGDIVGNGFILRGGNDPHTRFAADTPFYSGWDLPGVANPHIFQHKPLYTQLQGFSFQYDAEHVLVTVHEKPSHVRTLFQRLPGQPYLIHFNQFCFDLTTDHATPARKILVTRRKDGSETTLVNHFLRVRDTLQEQHRQHYGLRYDKARPAIHAEAEGLGVRDRFNAVFVEGQKWGIHRAFIMPIWRSPDTDINPVFEKQKGNFGVFGNLCCPLELEIADWYGGWDGFRELMEQAKASDLEAYIWHASHFSTLTPLTDRIPDLFCRDVNGQYNRNNYGHVLWAVNQRSGRYQEYLMACYRKAKSLGLSGLFHDSHFNLASDTINFLHLPYEQEGTPAAGAGGFTYPSDRQQQDQIVSMHDTCLELQRRLQVEIGLFYQVESEGALGTSQTSPEYRFIRGNEYIFSNMESGLDIREFAPFGDDPTDIYFRGLSTRLCYSVQMDPNRFPDPRSISPWWNLETMVPLVRGFGRVEPYMEELWILGEDRGTFWKSSSATVLFAYKDFDHSLVGPSVVENAVDGEKSRVSRTLPAKRHGIYLIRNA
jgi:hypothetical protein